MVLIGRRHWTGRRDGARMGTHFVARTAGLAVAVLGVVLTFRAYDVRADLSAEQISSLSRDTRQLLSGLDTEQAIEVTAYISPAVPEDYAQTRLTLLNMLRQFQRLSGGKLRVDVIETETKTEAASLASQQFGIEPVTVLSRERGAFRDEDIFLGCAFTCGLEVVVPFLIGARPLNMNDSVNLYGSEPRESGSGWLQQMQIFLVVSIWLVVSNVPGNQFL